MTEEFDKISERVRTLTTVLESMKERSDPTRNRQAIPKFLHHFVTLLTRGGKNRPLVHAKNRSWRLRAR
jgi:hypothetical protein